jgi:hypothetical protein
MNKLKIWKEWQKLINVTPYELEVLIDSEFQGTIKRWSQDLEEQGLFSPRQSADVLQRMIPSGMFSFQETLKNWNGQRYKGHMLWKCASIQISQIEKVIGSIDASLADIKSKLLLLKLWGHDLYRANGPLFVLPSDARLELYLEPGF